MKNQFEQFDELSQLEMVDLTGGGKVMELIFQAVGFVIGSIAKTQELNGDNGQWLA